MRRRAAGFQSSGSGPPSSGVFINAGGDVTVNDNSATSMTGVNMGRGDENAVRSARICWSTRGTAIWCHRGRHILIATNGLSPRNLNHRFRRDDRTLVFAPFARRPGDFQIVGSATGQISY